MNDMIIQTTIKVCQINELSVDEQVLVNNAINATSHSYAPYSHFSVGASVRLENGMIINGSNQENAAFPSGICAERTALFAAGATHPDVPVTTLAIAARGTDGQLTDEPISPCGACRQVMVETEKRAGTPLRILLYGRRAVYVIDGIKQLLPLTFNEI